MYDKSLQGVDLSDCHNSKIRKQSRFKAILLILRKLSMHKYATCTDFQIRGVAKPISVLWLNGCQIGRSPAGSRPRATP
jgi:hypothetical protein